MGDALLGLLIYSLLGKACLGNIDVRCFDVCEKSIAELKLQIFRVLFKWMAAIGLFSFSSLINFIDFCSFGA